MLQSKKSFNIIVLAKQVPDTRNVGKDAMKADGTVNRAALPAIFNPEDLNALEQALDAGDLEIGVSVHYVDETLDGGAIIKQVLFPIEESYSKDKIETILHQYEHKLYVEVLKELGEKRR